MKVEPKRVKKIPSPLLIVGLGGTGSDALLTIMDKFNRRYELPVNANGEVLDTPSRTAYLALDTDVLELASKRRGNMKFNPENILPLTIPSRLGMGALPEYITDWWDTSLTGYEIKNGAGGIRQVGRFVLFHNVDIIVDKLQKVIHSLLAIAAGGTMGTLEIVLTTGISGGTGSGTFMDMAYLIRNVMASRYPNVDYNFMAYILMPPVNVDKIPNITEHKQSMLESTGFAALKELDFWMNYNTHKFPYIQRYSAVTEVAWNKKPFDWAVLMGNATVNGDIIANAYANCLDVLSESVVNFFAFEDVSSDGQISLRSHLSNITNQSNYLHKSYPSNYTYMTVGAASSDAQQDEMATYESKLTFDRIEDLQTVDKIPMQGSRHSAPMLNDRAGELFLEEFYPRDTDYYRDFSAVKPDLNIFTDPSWTPQVVYSAPPVHEGFYNDWVYNCNLEARSFAVEKVAQLRKRFYGMVKDYATDLRYGPFTLSDFLKNSENGFVSFIHDLAKNWANVKEDVLGERNQCHAEVSRTLYTEMVNMSPLAKLTWNPAKKYFASCQTLFALERDYELANAISEEISELEIELTAYATTVLPAFCTLLSQVEHSIEADMKDVDMSPSFSDIATTAELKDYIRNTFGDPEVEALAIQVIGRMVDMSRQVKLDNMGSLEGMSDVQETFVKAADAFVLQAASMVNGISMDKLIDIKMPGATVQQKKDYLSQQLLPTLKRAAQTMLPLTVVDGAFNEFIPYAYASIPNNAPLIKDGVTQYQATEHITPKESDVSDRIYWLNTFNCVPMYMYTDLVRLEKAYDGALISNGVHGLHLVQVFGESDPSAHTLRHDWSQLPSPVVHVLEQVEPSSVTSAKHKQIAEMLEQALENGAVSLTDAPSGKEQLSLRIRMENGNIETMDQFDRKLNAIVSNAKLTSEEKIDKLNELSQEGTVITKEYVSYTQKFAEAAGLRLRESSQTDAEIKLVSENKEKARRMAAEYILYSWYPHITEQMLTQKEMFSKLQEAIENEKRLLEGAAGLQAFVNHFLTLYLTDAFTMGRTSVKFKNVHGDEEVLLEKSSLSDDELSMYNSFCPAVVILSALGNDSDTRINPHDRQFLKDKAAKYHASIDSMDDAEYAVLQKNAADFIANYAQTADAIRYDKGDMAKPAREQFISLLEMLRKAAKLYA